MNHTVDELAAPLDHIRRTCEETGRVSPVQVTLFATPEDEGQVELHAEAGVTRLIVRPWTGSRDAVDGLRRFAERFLAGGPAA